MHMKIAIGNDHAGTAYKLAIIGLLKSLQVEVINYGTDGTDSVDYPDFAQFLVEEGIDTISVTPDSMLKTIKAIHKIENKK